MSGYEVVKFELNKMYRSWFANAPLTCIEREGDTVTLMHPKLRTYYTGQVEVKCVNLAGLEVERLRLPNRDWVDAHIIAKDIWN